ncbi:NUDIX domain-containing protein [Amycolatopsis saalfeldensis]|uniref:NUDIX domain-containing protein n=1 Tax=Amycolatopsis saalfeldensis TaxID=394193 RepID=A0A1H8Y2K1_9PSEU|nr:NUDIX hydrolase [Amycolatopsis saalfeldensis]SEP46530.1 NUDIX domain-containing protein [Amycolatopsis saalfeldensis]
MTQVWPPPAEYYATLPKQIAGAGVIFRDTEGRVLLVEPNYGAEPWEIPGGALDEGESPWAGARREIKEELGFDLLPGRLLAVDWVPPQPDGRPALTNSLFDGGILDDNQIASLRLADGELKCSKFATREESAAMLRPHLARRVAGCLDALDTGQTAYLENGFDPLAHDDAP